MIYIVYILGNYYQPALQNLRRSRLSFKVLRASCLPIGSRYMIVDSKPYVVGGQMAGYKELHRLESGKDWFTDKWANLDVLAC